MVTAALVVGFIAYAPAHLARGICSGNGRFGAYGIVMGADGGIANRRLRDPVGRRCHHHRRVSRSSSRWRRWSASPLVLARRDLRTDPGPPAEWSEVTPNLGWLLLGSVFAAGLVNAGPIAVDLLAGRRLERPGHAVRLRRAARPRAAVPLPGRAGGAAAAARRVSPRSGELTEFRQGFRKLMMVVIGVGAAGVIGSAVLGPFVLEPGLRRRPEPPRRSRCSCSAPPSTWWR